MTFYPGSAGVTGNLLTVDMALRNPTHIEQRVADIAERDLLVDSVFTEGGPVEGGAVIYSEIDEKDLYTDTDVADRAPGDEYIIVNSTDREPRVARVQDFGGKFAITDEARDRNDTVELDNATTRLANTITRKVNQRVIATLTAAISKANVYSRTSGWDKVILDGVPDTITAPALRPSADLATLTAAAEKLDIGIEYTRLLVSPDGHRDLRIAYGTGLKAMLDDFGIDLLVSNSVPADRAFLVDPKQLGFVRYERPLTVTTWRDEATRTTWVQGYCLPTMGITLPAALGVVIGTNL
ncbi:major capsid protein [Corynebacterium provencense]|uniref:major capsid protein n=1 Tax=Corynebacterium provencense TaxID=1737425 RepID=UPI00083418C9|nr:major capsid protein [Corynebacterium provencense]